MDNIPVLRRCTDRWVHDSASENDAQDRYDDRLGPASNQSDGTHTPGLQLQISKNNDAVPLHLPCLAGILSDLGRTPESFQPAALGR